MILANKTYKKTLIGIHVAVWMIIILAPFTFFDHGDKFEADKIIPILSNPLVMMMVFYTMYLHITPKYLFSNQKKKFWIYSILLVVVSGISLHLWLQISHDMFFKSVPMPHRIPREPFHRLRPNTGAWLLLRNLFSMLITATIATMSVITMRWDQAEDARQKAELARQKAENARTEAELKNLRNQINPHFLLNTLNNIYALTAFDQVKAQEAIMELSDMLRHLLYDNQQEYVNLQDEVKFIYSYVNLMKIRISQQCDINVEVDIPTPCEILVAPLIFISLIENAFKHGVAASGKSFIHIKITADGNTISCFVENSNHPKQQTDRSGHGIGLEQVEKRLALSYGTNFKWEKGTQNDDSVYYSRITIYCGNESENV